MRQIIWEVKVRYRRSASRRATRRKTILAPQRSAWSDVTSEIPHPEVWTIRRIDPTEKSCSTPREPQMDVLLWGPHCAASHPVASEPGDLVPVPTARIEQRAVSAD